MQRLSQFMMTAALCIIAMIGVTTINSSVTTPRRELRRLNEAGRFGRLVSICGRFLIRSGSDIKTCRSP